MGKFVIEIQNLSRHFGAQPVLWELELFVPRGVVFGLVGENGAGKTTLIKHILGLLRAQQGIVRVFGLDPVADPEGVLGRIGYLSERRDLPDWMSVGELLRYNQVFIQTGMKNTPTSCVKRLRWTKTRPFVTCRAASGPGPDW